MRCLILCAGKVIGEPDAAEPEAKRGAAAESERYGGPAASLRFGLRWSRRSRTPIV